VGFKVARFVLDLGETDEIVDRSESVINRKQGRLNPGSGALKRNAPGVIVIAIPQGKYIVIEIKRPTAVFLFGFDGINGCGA